MNNTTIVFALAIVLILVIAASIANTGLRSRPRAGPRAGSGSGSGFGSGFGSGSGSGLTTALAAHPTQKPIPPFTGWVDNGNSYVIDYSIQNQLSGWQGVVSNDTAPITCPSQTLVPGKCAADLATAGSVCDNTPGCIGLIYNISDPSYPTATPVNSTPVQVPAGASPADGYRSVFMTPVAGERSGDMYASVEPLKNDVWSLAPMHSDSIITVLADCYDDNQTSAGSCGGVLMPAYDSPFAQNHLNYGMSTGYEYNTLVPVNPITSFTNAIALTYNITP